MTISSLAGLALCLYSCSGINLLSLFELLPPTLPLLSLFSLFTLDALLLFGKYWCLTQSKKKTQ